MSKTGTVRPGRKRWRWFVLGTLGAAGLVGGWYGFRATGLTPIHAQSGPAAAPSAGAIAEDQDRRVVAYLNESEPVSRTELGDYLIARRGPEKLDTFITRRIIEVACEARHVSVTTTQVESALAESIAGLNIGRERFIKEYLRSIHKNLYEWREDVLRPKLMMTQLCRDLVRVSEEEVRQAFEAKYGEKIDCRVIIWPKDQIESAQKVYATLRDSEAAFAEAAKKQPTSELASSGGRVKPVGRYTLTDRKVEEALFQLQPGEVSTLIPNENYGVTLVKCDKRLPPDTTASFEGKHDELKQEVFERKLQIEIGKFVKESRERAHVQSACGSVEEMTKLLRSPGAPGQVLATINGNVAITREELGEFLIARFGPESLELLLNRKIIDKACQAKGITVSDAEVEEAHKTELSQIQASDKEFVTRFLVPNGKTLYEWKEDLLRPKLMMSKLTRDQVKATEEDLHKAFDARYGERIQGRLILWKPEERRFVESKYLQLRDEATFIEEAGRQSNPSLASRKGEVIPFARNTTGLPRLEEDAFRLQPGEISALLELPEGLAIFRCEGRLPPTPGVTFEQKRAELTPLVIDRKTEALIPQVFNELKTKANPRPLIKDPNKPEDLNASMRRDMRPVGPPVSQPSPPAQAPQVH